MEKLGITGWEKEHPPGAPSLASGICRVKRLSYEAQPCIPMRTALGKRTISKSLHVDMFVLCAHSEAAGLQSVTSVSPDE